MIFIHDLNPVLFSIASFEARWYGFLFAVGLFLSYAILLKIFQREKLEQKDLDSLAIFLFFGLLIGARFGHILFYNFQHFSQNPIEILQIWKGGLSSHGATIGLFISYLIWIYIKKVRFSKFADLAVIVFPLTAFFVRIGNFFNSEIIGKETKGNFGVVFSNLGENFSRHPSQLYEAFLSLFIFGILMTLYLFWYKRLPKLFLMFTLVLLYFSSRFFVEFFKERVSYSDVYFLSKGQLLSILPVLIALGYFCYIAYLKYLKKS